MIKISKCVLKIKSTVDFNESTVLLYRSDGIRTHGLLVPNQARYQLRYTPKKNPQQRSCCGGWG